MNFRFGIVFMIVALAIGMLIAGLMMTGKGDGAQPQVRDFLQPGMPQGPNVGPWNHDLIFATFENDRLIGQPKFFVQAASVPSLARSKDGTLAAAFQWFSSPMDRGWNHIAVMISHDGGASWTPPAPVDIGGLPPNSTPPFDPCIVALSDGTWRLYFTTNMDREKDNPRENRICSAISSNATQYRLEPGTRFQPADGPPVQDAAIVQFQGRWQLFAPIGEGRAYHATSEDGLKFERIDDVMLPVPGFQFLGNAIVVDSKVRFYGLGQSGLSYAESADLRQWSNPKTLQVNGADPGVADLGSGKQLLIWTSPARPRVPQPQQGQPGQPGGGAGGPNGGGPGMGRPGQGGPPPNGQMRGSPGEPPGPNRGPQEPAPG